MSNHVRNLTELILHSMRNHVRNFKHLLLIFQVVEALKSDEQLIDRVQHLLEQLVVHMYASSCVGESECETRQAMIYRRYRNQRGMLRLKYALRQRNLVTSPS